MTSLHHYTASIMLMIIIKNRAVGSIYIISASQLVLSTPKMIHSCILKQFPITAKCQIILNVISVIMVDILALCREDGHGNVIIGMKKSSAVSWKNTNADTGTWDGFRCHYAPNAWRQSKLTLLLFPTDKFSDLLFSQYQFQCIQFPSQVFFRIMFMNERVAFSTDHNVSITHIIYVKVLLEPFIFMAGFRNQVMISNPLIRTA